MDFALTVTAQEEEKEEEYSSILQRSWKSLDRCRNSIGLGITFGRSSTGPSDLVCRFSGEVSVAGDRGGKAGAGGLGGG